ncbi:MAG: cupin domain-containing protein [Methylotenera sp.]
MSQIIVDQVTIEKNPSQSRLDTLGISKWPTWQKEVSIFSWTFPEQEIAYILEGECVVTPTGGVAVTFGKGDLVTFPAGMTVNWEVKKPLHKHYQLDGTLIGRIFRRAKLALKL